MILCGFYLVVKAFVRYWLFRPIEARPIIVRQLEVLRVFDFAAMLALVGAFFLLINSYNVKRTVMLMVILLLYDLGVYFLCLQLEVRRLLSSSSKWSYRAALRQVRRRARGASAH